MPTYDFLCAVGHRFEDIYTMAKVPDAAPCEAEGCELLAVLQISGGLEPEVQGGPGQTIKREAENESVFAKARITRRRKRSGEIPLKAHVGLKDVDVSGYTGPVNVPLGHPEHYLQAHKKKQGD